MQRDETPCVLVGDSRHVFCNTPTAYNEDGETLRSRKTVNPDADENRWNFPLIGPRPATNVSACGRDPRNSILVLNRMSVKRLLTAISIR